jgi:hypothetical protein
VRCDLSSDWQAFLQLTSDHRFLLHNSQLFDVRSQRNSSLGLDWLRTISADRVVGARRPYAFLHYPDGGVNIARTDGSFLSQVPVAHELLHLSTFQQVAVMDPATEEQVHRLAASNGNIISLSASTDGKTIAAIICDEEASGETQHRIQVWQLPEN